MDSLQYIVGIDFGSTHACARIYSLELEAVACSDRKINRIEGPDGSCELDPEAVWECLCQLLNEVLQSNAPIPGAKIRAEQIKCVGISVQRNSLLLWDRKTSQPRTRILTWQDLRAMDLATKWNNSFIFRSMKAGGHLLYWMTHRTPFKALASYRFKTALACVRLKYLLTEYPSLLTDCRRGLLCYGCLETWLLWRLTNGKSFLTDTSCASVSGMYDPFSCKWSGPILASLGIPPKVLPRVCPSGYYYGSVREGPLKTSDPLRAVPITGLIGDAQAATLTENCLFPGQAKLTLGTGSFLNLSTGLKGRAMTGGFYPVIGWSSSLSTSNSFGYSKVNPCNWKSYSKFEDLTYLIEGFHPNTGTLLEWLRLEGVFETYSELEEMLLEGDKLNLDEKTSTEHMFYVVLPQTSLKSHQLLAAASEDPKQRPYLGRDGVLANIKISKHYPERLLVARVVVESIIFTTKHMLEICRKEAGICPHQLSVNGNVARSDWLLQRMANVIGIPVERSGIEESSCMGAAIVAGVGAGLWPDFASATDMLHRRLASESGNLCTRSDNEPIKSSGLRKRFLPQPEQFKFLKQRYLIWSRTCSLYSREMQLMRI